MPTGDYPVTGYYRVCNCTLPYMDPTACSRCRTGPTAPFVTTASPAEPHWITTDDLHAKLRAKHPHFDETLRRIRESDHPNTKGFAERYK